MSTQQSPSIIITAGPSLDDDEVLRKMLSKNISWIRFNMSHGDHEEHLTRQKRIDRVAVSLDKKIKYFIDLQGPKMRVMPVEGGALELRVGEKIRVTSDTPVCTKDMVSVDIPELYRYLKVGMPIFLHDGSIELKVTEVNENGAQCDILRGGVLEGHKGVNIPDALIPINTITEKDRNDLVSALGSMRVDGVALSFVRTQSDIDGLRELLGTHGSSAIVISKIETKLALHNIKSILEASDIVMFARGDLGVEIPAVKIPITQKELCLVASSLDTPVIVATQMLTSMKESSIPTRAEMTDVIEALVNGASFLMLSDETTVGDYPVEAVSVLDEAIIEFTSNQDKYKRFENNI